MTRSRWCATAKVPVKTAARDLGLHPETLRTWVKRDRADRGEGAAGELDTAERGEARIAADVGELVVRNGYRLFALVPVQQSLEDVFVDLVHGETS